jgi:hypothetical protein
MTFSTYVSDLADMLGGLAMMFSPFLIALLIRKARNRKGLG